MTNRLQEQLLGHLLGALDESEAEQVAARLETEPRLHRQLESLRGRLATLEPLRGQLDPSPGLAEKTCRMVASYELSQTGKKTSGGSRRGEKTMTPGVAPPSWFRRVHWQDVAVTAIVCTIGWALIGPAILSSRENSRVAGCQSNLFSIGNAARQYRATHGSFPLVPERGPMASSGSYAVVLHQAGLLNDVRLVLCPGSPTAGRLKIRIPLIKELNSASRRQAWRLQQTMGGSYCLSLGYFEDGNYHAVTDLSRLNFALIADMPGYQGQSLNHGGRGQNVLFEDGRVRFLVTSRFGPVGDDIYTNDDGMPAAGTHPNDSVIAPPMPIVTPLPGDYFNDD